MTKAKKEAKGTKKTSLETTLKMIPVKRPPEEKIWNVSPNVPRPISNILISAPTCSGKSVVLVNLFYRLLQGCYNQVYWFSPTVAHDKTLYNNVLIDDNIVKISDPDQLAAQMENILKEIVKSCKENDEVENEKGEMVPRYTLIVLDDCIAYFGKGSKYLQYLATYCRHIRIALWVTSQNYMSFPKVNRLNTPNALLFRAFSDKEKKCYAETYNQFPDFIKYYEEAVSEPYGFLYVDVDRRRLFKGFETLLYEEPKNLKDLKKKKDSGSESDSDDSSDSESSDDE